MRPSGCFEGSYAALGATWACDTCFRWKLGWTFGCKWKWCWLLEDSDSCSNSAGL